MEVRSINITDIAGNKAPFEEEYGVTSEDFIPVEELLDRQIEIVAVKSYENDKGPGVFALVEVAGELRYLATHSIGLVSMMTDENVRNNLDMGFRVSGTIIRRKSKKSDRMVYAFA